ncbi:pyrroline-5-carboxylate reductase family protein [Emergencia sp.]|uniref:pyrroline-5-carboxylate reductase family protein n=1 Tax=Emergencia sp. TaxID=1926557 RepID=UPI003AEF314F
MKNVNKKIVFYGGGKMAENIIRGLIKNETMNPDNITVGEMMQARCSYLADTYGVTAVTDASEAIKEADMVLIGVNPPQIPSVTGALKPVLNEDTIVMSFACGVAIKVFENQLGSDKKVVRIVPNTLSQSGYGYSLAHSNGNLDEDDKAFVDQLLHGLGKVLYMEESKFDSFQGYGCTGPLWIYKFVEAMIDAGIYVGFTRAEARELILENMLGTVKILQETGASPTAKIEELTSPGGVTIEALRALQENGSYMRPTIASMEAAVKKCAIVAS